MHTISCIYTSFLSQFVVGEDKIKALEFINIYMHWNIITGKFFYHQFLPGFVLSYFQGVKGISKYKK